MLMDGSRSISCGHLAGAYHRQLPRVIVIAERIAPVRRLEYPRRNALRYSAYELHQPSLIPTMHHDRVDFSDSIDGNPITLLNCERMICGLKLDPWAKSVVAKMDSCLQIHRLRIGLEPSVQPPEERTHVGSMFLVEDVP